MVSALREDDMDFSIFHNAVKDAQESIVCSDKNMNERSLEEPGNVMKTLFTARNIANMPREEY